MLLYHFVNEKYGIENLTHRRIKISTLDRLNDPFEMRGFAITKASDRRAWDGWFKHMAGRYGILCFSEGWRNPVQWTHYADNHSGLCMAFEIEDKFATKVKYGEERKVPNLAKDLQAGKIGEEFVTDALTRKFSHWQYEQEWRVFLPIHDKAPIEGKYFADFGNDLVLKRVYLGARATSRSQAIRDAMGDLAKKVPVVTTRLAFKTFEICRQKALKRQK